MLRITGRTLLITMLLGLPAGYRLDAQVPGMISYQARIIDEQAGPVNDTRAITFAVYAQAEGGTAVWSEQQNVAIVDGLADVMLGKTVPLTAEIFQSGERYLGVKIGSDPELKPRKRLLAVPYALRAESATIRITPSGGISSKDVNSAIQELDAEKLSLTGGTLSGRLNIYNEESNDVGIDALSADSAAILAMNSGSTDPAMVAYNYGEGDGMYSFAEMGNALWAYNNSEGYVTIYASTDGNTNVFKGWSESEYPNIFVENEGSGSGIYGYSNSGNGVWGEAEGGYAAVGGSNSGEGSGVYGHSTARNGVWAVAEGEYAAVAAESQSSGTGVYAYSAEGFGGVFATDAAEVCAVYAVAAEGSASNPGLYVDGYATITGGVSSTMLTSAGLARAHGVSSPQAEFSFSGSARLSAGETEVAFASTWQDCISGAADYRVLITPTEMCNGICCVEKTPSGFRVRELANGTSSASFDWMVRAVQKGSSTEKILLSGAGQPDPGMEIIDPEQVKLLQAGIDKQKRMQASQSPDLASARPSAGASAQAGAARKTSPEMGSRMQRVKEYRERLKQRAQDR